MADFVVEDGTGLSTANSYISEADADTYFDNYIRNHTDWDSLGSLTKQVEFDVADVDGLSSIDGLADLGTPISGGDSVSISLSGFVTADLAYNWLPGTFDTCPFSKHLSLPPDTEVHDDQKLQYSLRFGRQYGPRDLEKQADQKYLP